jgi:hypothetical protein
VIVTMLARQEDSSQRRGGHDGNPVQEAAKRIGIAAAGAKAGPVGTAVTLYLYALNGVVARAASASQRLRVAHPTTYLELYKQDLDTLCFLVEDSADRLLNILESAGREAGTGPVDIDSLVQQLMDASQR